MIRNNLADLILTLATRPGITDPETIETLKPAARKAGEALQGYLNHPRNTPERFSSALLLALDQFRKDYVTVPPEAEGAEARALAVNHLYQRLFDEAQVFGISPEVLEMAILSGFAEFERQLSLHATARNLTMAERGLVDLLLIGAVHQIHVHSFFEYFPQALTRLGVTPVPVNSLFPDWEQVWACLLVNRENFLKPYNEHLERYVLADAITLADPQRLVANQFNLEAMFELFMLKITFELSGQGYDTHSLLERMRSLGGVMAEVSLETLIQGRVVDTFDWSGDLSEALGTLAVFDWVRPEMLLGYRPWPRLGEQLSDLGEEPQMAPDYTLFAEPYSSIFQLEYDFDLCDQLAQVELNLVADQALNVEMRPLSMQERFSLRRADLDRRIKAIGRLSGANETEKEALRQLLTPAVLFARI